MNARAAAAARAPVGSPPERRRWTVGAGRPGPAEGERDYVQHSDRDGGDGERSVERLEELGGEPACSAHLFHLDQDPLPVVTDHDAGGAADRL